MISYIARRLIAGLLHLSVFTLGLWLLVNYTQACLNRAPRGIIVDPWICLKPTPLNWVDIGSFVLFVLFALFLARRLTWLNFHPDK